MLSVGDGLPGGFCHVMPSRMSPTSGGKRGAEGCFYAMKTAMRLAQRSDQQAIE
jgi:hypothetical protein